MNLAEMILNQNGGAIVEQLAGQLGIGSQDARRAAEQVLPKLARGVQRNASQPAGLEALLGALKGGSHQRYFDHPEELGSSATVADGNAILGHLLGSKDVSRNVAGHAASETGVDASLIKKMLPMLAAAAMGALSKQTAGGGSLAPVGSPTSGGSGLDLLSSFLDSDRDGSIADDLLGLAKKFF